MTADIKKRRKGLIVLTVIFGLIAVLLFLAYSSNAHLTKSRYEVSSSDLPDAFDGFKIVQISDLHTKSFGDNNKSLLKAIDKEDPDMVVMTGDIVNSTDDPEDFDSVQDLMAGLSEKYPVYYIDGNHETAMNVMNEENYNRWIECVKDSGVTILDNDSTSVEKDGSSFELYGLWYNGRYYNDMGDDSSEKYYLDMNDMYRLVGHADKGRFNLLLTHNPIYFQEYADWGADLTLAGHMHGGMIRVPFKGGLISPERVYWPEYDAGEFTIGDSVMIVNRGLGNGTSGYRYLNWPDISVITLKSS